MYKSLLDRLPLPMGEDERESKGTRRGQWEVSLERLFGPDDKKLHIQCEGDLQKATPEGS